jgi:hypothetical protein
MQRLKSENTYMLGISNRKERLSGAISAHFFPILFNFTETFRGKADTGPSRATNGSRYLFWNQLLFMRRIFRALKQENDSSFFLFIVFYKEHF